MYNAHWIHSLPYSKFIELTLIKTEIKLNLFPHNPKLILVSSPSKHHYKMTFPEHPEFMTK